jgi:hypothetical protein
MNKHYAAICEYYGDRKAERSGVPLISHIDEGLCLLDAIGAGKRAMEAFCIHPLVQDDDALQEAIGQTSVFARHAIDPVVGVLATEYRRVANAYLSHHCKGDGDEIECSHLPEVNAMLVADKVQNRKDFEIHHLGSHPNSAVLQRYFANWLRRLDISETRYGQLIGLLDQDVGRRAQQFMAQ